MRGWWLVAWGWSGVALGQEPRDEVVVEEASEVEEATEAEEAAGAEPPAPPEPADADEEPEEQGFVMPALVQGATPIYPAVARARGVSGTVVLLVTVDEGGRVSQVDVEHGVEETVDLAATDAARQLRFRPARQDGEPVAVQLRYQFTFSLDTADEQGNKVPGSLLGEVVDAEGLAVPGAMVRLVGGDGAAVEALAGDDGHFRLGFLGSGIYRFTVSHGSFQTLEGSVLIEAGAIVERTLVLLPVGSEEIVVTWDRRTWREVDRGALEPREGTVTGQYTLTRRDIESTPGSMEDVARAVHALPGVAADGDMLATFHVRGGETDEVVFLLDRVPIYDPFHLAGFNSIFNPDLISEVQFYAGAPPASVPSGTSAVMAVETWDGEPRQEGGGIDGALDISASSLRAFAMGPVSEDLTVALAVRRSYLEAYFQVMKWANVVDTAFAAPEFSEVSGRAAWKPASGHRVMLTAMRAGDSLGITDSEDQSLIQLEGTFELANTLDLVSLDHTWTVSEAATWRSTLAAARSRSELENTLAGDQRQDLRSDRLYGRSDVRLELGKHTVDTGLDAAGSRVWGTTELPDRRSDPTWNLAPIGKYERENLVYAADLSWAEASAWLEEEWAGPVRIRGGGRATWVGLTDEVLLSPRGGLSVPLPTGTIPKVAAGRYHHTRRDPRLYDPVLGNPGLRSEQATEVVLGIDQGFPLPGEEAGGMVRLEVYQTWLEDLVVNPDNEADVAAGATYDNSGTGTNQGFDLLVAGRRGRIRGMASWSMLWADRLNPLNTVLSPEVDPKQEQRHTVNANIEWQASPRWRLTARYGFHTGRPVSTVAGSGVVDPETDIESLVMTCLNCERMGPTHNLDLRAEWRKVMRSYRLTFYAEVLNATYARSDFIPITTIEAGERRDSMLYHLPTRPFLGLRADF